MAVRIIGTQAGTRPDDAEVELIAQAVARYGRCTLLVPSIGERDVVRTALAEAGCGLGVDVTTVRDWIGNLWELLGGGEHPCTGIQRQLLMADILYARVESELAPLRANPGTVRLLATIARDLLPFADASAEGGAGGPAEAVVLDLLARYRDALASRALIEASDAAVRLASALDRTPIAAAGCVVLRDVTEVPAYLARLLSVVARIGEVSVLLRGEQGVWAASLARAFGSAGCEVVCEDAPERIARVPEIGFLEVAGPHARDRAYAEELTRLVGTPGRHAVVVSARPAELADRLAPWLASRGIASEVTRFVRFERTAVGRQFTALRDLVGRMKADLDGSGSAAEWWPAPELSDWLYSPLSGIDIPTARRFDKKIRSSRALGVEGVLRELQSVQSRVAAARRKLPADHPFASVPAICSDVVQFLWQDRPVSAFKTICAAIEKLPAQAFGSRDGPCRIAVERAMAERALQVVADDAHALRVGQAVACRVLDGLCVVSRERIEVEGSADAEPAGEVAFMTLADAACLEADSVDALLFADVDVASYPLSHEESARTTLATRLDARALELEPAACLRDLTYRALAAARGARILARVTHDRQAKDRYPAAIWTELRAAVGDGAHVRRVGEEDVAGDFDAADGRTARLERVSCLPPRQLSPQATRYLVLTRVDTDGHPVPRQFSASQIETYSACPLCWFVSSRLRPSVIDAGFTNMEKGNFVHDVMDRFHERLLEDGSARVTPENLDASLTLLHDVFAEVAAEHARGKTSSSAPLVPLSVAQKKQVDEILPQLEKVVRYEADALAAYAPAYLEYSFNGLGVTYAGWPLGGRIDRVDVDAEGHAVVIDYKHRSDVTPFRLKDPTAPDKKTGVAPADDPRWLPEHTQTLIYAQALRRALDLDVRGAVYFATKGKVAMRGAVSEELAEEVPGDGRVPGLRDGFPAADAGGTMAFDELLDRVEREVGIRLEELAAGCVTAASEVQPSCVHNHPLGFVRRDA
ncbi:PD-(D/E)XK nuclease family protein [Collinsella tanakaei]|uniref:PD-(D/E)XK nuclease family protein n=1 Tax=Collinsella tanakaei TaxID=626935 RepID=UPI001F2A7517|nr:PD-(D/E)XK nuclease family protein [Collinsella tanakaei]MCF2621240.1 PD-(D/E)XK nuclease family protein [Collinsella tanakaei]